MLIAGTLAFTAGVLAVTLAPALPPAWLWAVLLLPTLLPWRGRIWCVAALLGAAYAGWHANALLAERWPAQRHGEDLAVTGVITDLPARQGRDWRFVLAPDPGGLPSRVRVSWYRTDETVRAGQCWEFTLRMRAPRGSVNPGAFDYESWLFRSGIGATAYVREAQRCESRREGGLHAWRERLREHAGRHLHDHAAAPLVAALVVGDRSGLSDADWEAFRSTGTSHLMAISGLHVGLVAGFAYLLLRALWALSPWLCLRLPAPRAGLLAGSAAALAYAALAGFSVPTQRALAMWLVVAVAAWLGRLSSPARVLVLAWLAVLIVDPFAVLGAGTWLSFGAVAAILYVLGGRLGPVSRTGALVRLQFALALALAPLTLLFFGGAAWASPLVNLVAVPAFFLLLPALLAALAASLLWPGWGGQALYWVADALQWARAGLDWVTVSAPKAWFTAVPPVAATALALAGVVLALAPRGLPVRPLAALLCLPLLFPPARAPQEGFSLAVLDVGQGLAVAVRTARHVLLYDAGPAFPGGFDAGAGVVVPYLRQAGVSAVDTLVLSHRHMDHQGGIGAVRAALPVHRELATDRGPPCVDGQRWRWDGVEFEMLHPAADDRWTINNISCVLRVSAGAYSALITGDIERDAEWRLLRDRRERLRADVLVAPHHGSATSSTVSFVHAVSPSVVLYGAGWRNRYRHPRPEVVQRYQAMGAVQYYTGGMGALELHVHPENGVSAVTAWRPRSGRLWRAETDQLP